MSTLKVNRIEPRTGDTVEIVGFEAGGGGLQSAQSFTSLGTWTKPDGISKVVVEVQGGGGGGGRSSSDNPSGGGAGGYCKSIYDVSAITSASIQVGVGGGSQTAGGASIWDDGTNTMTANGGGAGSNGSASAGGGAASGGNIINAPGGRGGIGKTNQGPGSGGVSFMGGSGAEGSNITKAPNATGYGGGGGGGDFKNNGTGAAGSQGIVIVWEYA